MSLENAMNIINGSNNLDYDVKACLNKNIDEINETRRISQEKVTLNCNEIFK
jgi:hypothetical protein